jgi:hypothetical protein
MESALLLVVRAILLRSVSLHHCCLLFVLERHSLFFLHSFSQLSRLWPSQLSRYGLATPSHRDGSCAGSPICRQPVLAYLMLKIDFEQIRRLSEIQSGE